MLQMQKEDKIFRTKNIDVIRVKLLESQLMELKRISIETVVSVSIYNKIMLWLKILTLIGLLIFFVQKMLSALKLIINYT